MTESTDLRWCAEILPTRTVGPRLKIVDRKPGMANCASSTSYTDLPIKCDRATSTLLCIREPGAERYFEGTKADIDDLIRQLRVLRCNALFTHRVYPLVVGETTR